MADVKISELPAAAALTGAETLPGVQGGTTVKITTRALQRIGINNQTGTTYTAGPSDAGKMVRCNNSAAISFALQTGDVFASGDVVMVRQVGAGQVTASGGTLNIKSGASAKTRAQGCCMSLHYVGTDTWDVDGDLA